MHKYIIQIEIKRLARRISLCCLYSLMWRGMQTGFFSCPLQHTILNRTLK